MVILRVLKVSTRHSRFIGGTDDSDSPEIIKETFKRVVERVREFRVRARALEKFGL
jgi:hypothetical protein